MDEPLSTRFFYKNMAYKNVSLKKCKSLEREGFAGADAKNITKLAYAVHTNNIHYNTFFIRF